MMPPANPPRFCAHLFFVRKSVVESIILQAPTLEEIKEMFMTKLVVNTGRPAENFRIGSRLVAKDNPFHIWELTCAQAPGAWVKVHKLTDSCPPGWAT